VEISVAPLAPRRALLSVRDRGIGIADADLGKIFRPFYRLHDARHVGGLGVGLFIVAEIARAHGGQIRVNSVLDEGTLFEVELPTGETDGVSPDLAAPAPAG
jgi:signal transduction histidine kinase